MIKIEETKHIPADLMNYVLPYVVSFMGLDYTDENKLWGFFVFFFWIFVITHKSGQVIMNPVLTVFGWRLYDVRYSHVGGSGAIFSDVALSKKALEPSKVYHYSSIQSVVIIR